MVKTILYAVLVLVLHLLGAGPLDNLPGFITAMVLVMLIDTDLEIEIDQSDRPTI